MRTAFVLAILSACRSAADRAPDSSVQDATIVDAIVPTPPEAAAPATTVGEWERTTAPYVGLRIAIDASGVGKVTRTSTIDDRDPKKRELACQASLWKPGDVYLEGGSVIVRDWGLVAGRCEHRDTHAPATLALADGAASLVMSVKRGKSVDQTWSRVEP